MKVTFLAPAYNEEAVIRGFVETVVRNLPNGGELLIVDDGSTDATPEILEALATVPELRVVTHEANRGIGAAIKTGFSEAHGEVIVAMDADLSHPMEIVSTMIEGCETADAVYARRYVRGGGMIGIPWCERQSLELRTCCCGWSSCHRYGISPPATAPTEPRRFVVLN